MYYTIIGPDDTIISMLEYWRENINIFPGGGGLGFWVGRRKNVFPSVQPWFEVTVLANFIPGACLLKQPLSGHQSPAIGKIKDMDTPAAVKIFCFVCCGAHVGEIYIYISVLRNWQVRKHET